MSLLPSLMRTLVPYGVALLLSVATGLGVTLDNDVAVKAVEFGLAAAYYALFRLLEAGAGRVGWGPLRIAAGVFLGWARPPRYGPG